MLSIASPPLSLCLLLAISLLPSPSLPAHVDFRIVRGNPVHIRDVPFFVIVLKHGVPHCGGSILTKTLVLTAGHCEDGARLEVVAGYNKEYANMQKVDVFRAIRHPNYRHKLSTRFTPSILDYDVALFVLAHELYFTQHVRPVTLALELYQVPPTGTKLVAVGAGMLREAAPINPARTNLLYNVTLPVFDFEQCARVYRRVHVKLTALNFCAGYEAGRFDVCNGDSGGPLMLSNIQFGIVSFGHGCGRPGYPSVFTTVSRVLNWVQTYTNATAGRVGDGGWRRVTLWVAVQGVVGRFWGR